jgi:hypothetical protein
MEEHKHLNQVRLSKLRFKTRITEIRSYSTNDYVTTLIPVSLFVRVPSSVTITIDQNQLENVKCFRYLGSLLTDDGRCTCEIKSRIAMAKAAFNKKKNLFTSKLNLI